MPPNTIDFFKLEVSRGETRNCEWFFGYSFLKNANSVFLILFFFPLSTSSIFNDIFAYFLIKKQFFFWFSHQPICNLRDSLFFISTQDVKAAFGVQCIFLM